MGIFSSFSVKCSYSSSLAFIISDIFKVNGIKEASQHTFVISSEL